MPADVVPFRRRNRNPFVDPSMDDALAEVIQCGLTVTRLISRLAEMERAAAERLPPPPEPAPPGHPAPPPTPAQAAAIRSAAASAKLASMLEGTHREIRKTAALRARLAGRTLSADPVQPTPLRRPPSPESDPPDPDPPDSDASRPDTSSFDTSSPDTSDTGPSGA